MSKKKTENGEADFYADLAEKTGGTLLKGQGKSKYLVDTGNLALNYINSGRFIAGGLPTGITEIYGPSQSAKSLIGYTLMGRCHRMGGYTVLLDNERASNEQFALTAGHLDPGKVIVQKKDSIERVQMAVIDVTKRIRAAKGPDVPILFVWDSIGVTPCDRECRELELPVGYTKEQYKQIVGGKEQPGERAKASSGFLRKINPFLDEYNASMFVINQIRYKIGVMFGSPETTAGGGNSLPYYANTRIRSSAQQKIIDKKRDVKIGVNLKLVNTKSRLFDPYLDTEGVQLYFRQGINPLGGLLRCLVVDSRVEQLGGGNYQVVGKYCNDQVVKFKASKEANLVPPELLYQCPALVDAESAEQIQEYIGPFTQALSLHMNENVSQEAVSSDEEGLPDDELQEMLEVE